MRSKKRFKARIIDPQPFSLWIRHVAVQSITSASWVLRCECEAGGWRTKAEATKVASQRSECRQTNGRGVGRKMWLERGHRTEGEARRRFPHFPCCFCLKWFFAASHLGSPQLPSRRRQRSRIVLMPILLTFFSLCKRGRRLRCVQGCRLLLSQSVAITSVKWRQKDDGQRQHATRCCNLKTNSLPLSVYVWKNNEAKIETKIKPCLPRKLLRVNSTGAGAEGGSASASKFIYLKFQLFA